MRFVESMTISAEMVRPIAQPKTADKRLWRHDGVNPQCHSRDVRTLATNDAPRPQTVLALTAWLSHPHDWRKRAARGATYSARDGDLANIWG